MINLFEIEPEKIYGLPANEPLKQQKITTHINSNQYVASLKKDGQYHRYVNYEGEVKMQTRGKSVVTGTFGDVKDKVPHLMAILNDIVPKNSLLIGELYFHNGTTNDVGSILRCLAPKAVKRQEKQPLIFYIHDVWAWNDELLLTKTKEQRNEILSKIEELFESKGAMAHGFIEFAEYVDTVSAIHKLVEYAFDNNEEGVVLTLKNAIVNPGARTAWKTLKIKKELQNDADVFLTGNFKEPTKKYDGIEVETWKYWLNLKTGEKLEGIHYKDYLQGMTLEPITKPYFMSWPGSVEMAVVNKNGDTVSVGWLSGLSDEIKEDFARNNDNYKLKVCRIQAMETTEDNKLRHAKFLEFRDDITYQDCTFEKIFGDN